MVIRHTPKKRTPIQPMEDKLEEARLRELPTKAETGFIRRERKRRRTRYDEIEEGMNDKK